MFEFIKKIWQTAPTDSPQTLPARAVPSQASALEICTQAGQLLERGLLLQALEQYQLAIQADPQCAKAYRLLGYIYKEQQELQRAQENLQTAIKLNQQDADALYMLGNILMQQGDHQAALDYLSKASQLDPANPFALSDWIYCLHMQGENQLALELVIKAIKQFPEISTLYLYRGNIERALQDFAAAEASYRLALEIHPDSLDLLRSIAEMQYNQNHFLESIQTHEKILSIQPDDHDTRLFLGFCQLALGQLKAGFANYQYRYRIEGGEQFLPVLDRPIWEGDLPLNDKVLLIVAEQGFGDFIQFVRYTELIKQAGGRYLLFVLEPLKKLLQDSFGDLVYTKFEEIPHFDYYCSVVSLPYAFKTEQATIPKNLPYLKANSELIPLWRERLQPVLSKPLIGISWSGNSQFKRDSFRSIALAEFLNLTSPEFNYIILQTTVSAEESERLQHYPNIYLPADAIQNFADTAAIMQLCATVISVDTAIIHLAGALGCQAHLLLAFSADWRWAGKTEETDWYPSLSLHRQTQSGDWKPVLARVKQRVLEQLQPA